MTHGSLFSGIGGFDLAAEWMGWQNIFHCEIGEFPRKILKHHFPNSICYEDIKKTDFTKHRGQIDIISGGFPCQPYSNAGKRRGKEDDRHLWPEMCRVIREVQPRFVVGENVAGLLSWNNGMVFHEIITDLENEGYETQAFLIPACATNAPHRRDRIWFVAYSLNCGYSAERAKETETDGIQSKIGKAMDTREFNGTSVSRITAHTDNGSGLRDTVQSRRTELEELHDSPSNVANTDGTEQGNNLGENIGEKGEIRWGEEGDVFGELRGDGNVADTNSIRGRKDNWRINRESDVINQNGEARNVADSNSKRHEKRNTTTESIREARFNSEKNFTNHSNFENFPTQSPICGGDDGIPTQLDGITFPKWRNESIKGYGNAVVPQVVYQIFKAIEQSLL
jgi:DNA (cytosine-5)-methyltransferase 1